MNISQRWSQLSDEALITEILAGNKALFEILIRRYNGYLFKVGRSCGFNQADTEDLMQDVYASAYGHLADFEGRARFKTWLVKIMLHQCYHKKAKFSYQKEQAVPDHIDVEVMPMFTAENNPSDHLLIRHELRHIIEKALLSIPPDLRLVFTLRELNGLSTKEASEALDISAGNVKTRLTRAKAMLRTALYRMYTPEEIFEYNLIYCDAMVKRVMERI